MIIFEDMLAADLSWGLDEADRYFSGKGLIRLTLRELAHRLDEHGIEYAVVGAVAMFSHGYRRFTQDVDILVTPEGLAAIEKHLLGHGYARPNEWRRGFRDVETGVAIHVFVSGLTCGVEPGYVLPRPDERSTTFDGTNVLDLAAQLEMKFALGSAPGHRRHLGDAQELIRYTDVPSEFETNLAPQFRDRFAEYWRYAQIAKADDY